MTSDWKNYKKNICERIEEKVLGFSINDKKILISAILSEAYLNEKNDYNEQLKKIGVDKSLETIGDYVLDFVIVIDHFAKNSQYTPKQLDDFRQWYGKNSNLHKFSKETLHLQDFILWVLMNLLRKNGTRHRQRCLLTDLKCSSERFILIVG